MFSRIFIEPLMPMSSIYVSTSSPILGLFRAFRAFIGASTYTPYAAKIGVCI